MPTVLEQDRDHGDAKRLELLHVAGAADAEILMIAVDDKDACMEIIEHAKKHFPHLAILARACSRDQAYLLHEAEVKYFIEQLSSSLDCAIKTLDLLGHDLNHAKNAARRFKEKEIESIETSPAIAVTRIKTSTPPTKTCATLRAYSKTLRSKPTNHSRPSIPKSSCPSHFKSSTHSPSCCWSSLAEQPSPPNLPTSL